MGSNASQAYGFVSHRLALTLCSNEGEATGETV